MSPNGSSDNCRKGGREKLKPNSGESRREWAWPSPTLGQGYECVPVMPFAHVRCAEKMPMQATMSFLLLRTACRTWFLLSPMFQHDRLAEAPVTGEVHSQTNPPVPTLWESGAIQHERYPYS